MGEEILAEFGKWDTQTDGRRRKKEKKKEKKKENQSGRDGVKLVAKGRPRLPVEDPRRVFYWLRDKWELISRPLTPP